MLEGLKVLTGAGLEPLLSKEALPSLEGLRVLLLLGGLRPIQVLSLRYPCGGLLRVLVAKPGLDGASWDGNSGLEGIAGALGQRMGRVRAVVDTATAADTELISDRVVAILAENIRKVPGRLRAIGIILSSSAFYNT